MICHTSLSEIESDVLRRVHYAGALTRRSLIRDYGPYPNWQRLVVDGPLHEVATVYGTVICYSAQGYRWALTAGFADPPSSPTCRDRPSSPIGLTSMTLYICCSHVDTKSMTAHTSGGVGREPTPTSLSI